MQPLFFGSEPKRLFGVYHGVESREMRESGVLLCPPIGQEGIRAHRACRQLATLLAQAGFPTLRFDYFATGDSAGESADGSVESWIQDVRTATDELKDLSGVERVSWVGFRFGASLAVLAARGRRDLDALVLIEPVVSGGDYLRELGEMHAAFMRAEFPEFTPGRSRDSAAGLDEAIGWPMSARLREEIAAIDLPAGPVPPVHRIVLISASEEEREDQRRIIGKAAAIGLPATFIHAADATLWNQEDVRVPMKTLQAVITTLS